MEAGVLLVVHISVGRLFQTAGPERLTELNDVRGTSKALLSADLRPGRLVVTGSSISAPAFPLRKYFKESLTPGVYD